MANGYVIWEGASEIDGTPIALVLTLSKGNGKTAMGGLSILPGIDVLQPFADQAIARSESGKLYGPGSRGAGSILLPIALSGLDAGICGDCRHRWDPTTRIRSCYVNLGQGIDVVAKVFVSGGYQRVSTDRAREIVAGMDAIRTGIYGDPLAVPASVYRAVGLPRETTGDPSYTHAWRTLRTRFNAGEISAEDVALYQRLCMASADSAADRLRARSWGWRTFRVRTVDASGMPEALQEGERVCPASHEGGRKLTCAPCGQCDGTRKDGDRRPDRAIIDHSHRALRLRKRSGDLAA